MGKTCFKYGIIVFLLFSGAFSPVLRAQSFNYWSRNFNEESSLVSGAVVGGGAGPSSIYYNPAIIGEKNNSQLAIHASLFSINNYKLNNALGPGGTISSTQFVIEPRFISYILRPHKHWTFEFAFLNNENYRLDINTSIDRHLDILTRLPGDERYFARFMFVDRYRDDWIGAGGSFRINNHLKAGISMMVPIRQIDYNYLLDIQAMPLSDTIPTGDGPVPYYTAASQEMEYIHFNNFRLLWKIGFVYSRERFGLGLTITTPSVNVFSNGKRVSMKELQSNIMDMDTAVMLPNYDEVDYEEKNNVKANFKSPLSVALGGTFIIPGKYRQVLYLTTEYFARISPYPVVRAREGWVSPNGEKWLTFLNGGKSLLNGAVGYKIALQKNLQLMMGFRTDFNSRKDLDLDTGNGARKMKGLTLDIYHINGGVLFTFRGQDFIMGLQYSVGRETGQTEFANLEDPMEFNPDLGKPLQGVPQNDMEALINNINIYFGATFNFNMSK